ncbi:MAG: DUF3574 domain-containing protein [Verrucomicrobiota bacterium]
MPLHSLSARLLRSSLLAATSILVVSCATVPEGPAEDVRLEAEAAEWMETSLYFGLRRVGGNAPFAGITEARWTQFLDEEVSPRFPAGFSVLDAYGQWVHMHNNKKTPNRLDSKVIVLLHPATPEDDAKIEAIRAAFKEQFKQESVLRSTHPAAVSF